jgi:malate/lactate dehydrogenase
MVQQHGASSLKESNQSGAQSHEWEEVLEVTQEKNISELLQKVSHRCRQSASNIINRKESIFANQGIATSISSMSFKKIKQS